MESREYRGNMQNYINEIQAKDNQFVSPVVSSFKKRMNYNSREQMRLHYRPNDFIIKKFNFNSMHHVRDNFDS